MSKLPLISAPHLELIGDLEDERWPSYLSSPMRIRAVIDAIACCDFRIERVLYGFAGDPLERFLVGEEGWSRRLAIHHEDPTGVVLVLEDDGTAWSETATGTFNVFKTLEVVEAYTLGELIKDGYAGVKNILGSNIYRNARLSQRPADPAIPQPPAAPFH